MIHKKFTAGDSFSWREEPRTGNLGNFIDSSYTLKLFLRGKTTLDLVAIAEGSGWRFSITTQQSSSLDEGTYYYQLEASKDDSKETLDSGSILVLKNLSAQAAGFDGRSQTEKDLEAVQSAIRALISGGTVQKYKILNREIEKIPLNELMVYEDRLKNRLRYEKKAERLKNGMGDTSSIYVRFTQ